MCLLKRKDRIDEGDKEIFEWHPFTTAMKTIFRYYVRINHIVLTKMNAIVEFNSREMDEMEDILGEW